MGNAVEGREVGQTCICREAKCPVCWPRCHECDSALGDEEVQFCASCCTAFEDCLEQEMHAREHGPPAVSAPSVVPVKVEPPMSVGTVQQTFDFGD